MNNTKESFSIDLYSLEEEWVEHPDRFYEYSIVADEAREKLDLAKLDENKSKDTLEEVCALVELSVRKKDPSFFNLDKYTESTISKLVKIDSKTMQAQRDVYESKREVIEAQRLLSDAETAVKAMEHRKKALEKSVDLFIAGYFAKPREPKASRDQGGLMARAERDKAFSGKRSKSD